MEEANADRREGILRRWQEGTSRTAPANRPVAEAAVRQFFKEVGTFGELQKVIWADSFPSFAGCVQALAKDFCWIQLRSILREPLSSDGLAGTCLSKSLPADTLQTGYRSLQGWEAQYDWEQDPHQTATAAENEESPRSLVYFYRGEPHPDFDPSIPYEEDLQSLLPLELTDRGKDPFQEYEPDIVLKKLLVPTCYDTNFWADIEYQIAQGNLSAQSPRAHLADALMECAACFPGPGVAVCCEFPSAILPEDSDHPLHPAGQVLFRNSEKQFLALSSLVSKEDQWRKILHFDTLPAEEVLKLPQTFHRNMMEKIGLERIMRALPAGDVLAMADWELRRDLINATSAQDFLTRCEKTGISIEVVGEPDDYGRLLRVAIPHGEDYQAVEVLNSTPEPDGKFKNYYLRVPPDIATPREAVAWTFEVREEDYDPFAQT